MKLAQLKALVKQGESKQLEFKTTTASLHTDMQAICAFLNSPKRRQYYDRPTRY